MLVTTKTSTLYDFVDYQNVGPIMNFPSVFTHARDRCFVTSEYVTNNDCGGKAMPTISQLILQEFVQ